MKRKTKAKAKADRDTKMIVSFEYRVPRKGDRVVEKVDMRPEQICYEVGGYYTYVLTGRYSLSIDGWIWGQEE